MKKMYKILDNNLGFKFKGCYFRVAVPSFYDSLVKPGVTVYFNSRLNDIELTRKVGHVFLAVMDGKASHIRVVINETRTVIDELLK